MIVQAPEKRAAPVMLDMGSFQLMLMPRWFEGNGRGVLWWCVQLLRHALPALAWGRRCCAAAGKQQHPATAAEVSCSSLHCWPARG